MTDKLLTTEQVSGILQVHPFTVLKYIKQGKLKGIKLGRVWRIRESDVDKFIEERSAADYKKEPQKAKEEAEPVKKEESKEPDENEEMDHYIIE
jgi:excisionase family DNA binding protein